MEFGWSSWLARAVVRVKTFVASIRNDTTGAVAAEYAFLLALIAIVIVAGAIAVGSVLFSKLSAAADAFGG